MKLDFFIPVHYSIPKKNFKQILLEKVDGYFFLGGQKAFVINLPKDSVEKVSLDSVKISTAEKIAKICSYPLLALPMLFAKAVLRATHKFEVELDEEEVVSKTQAVAAELASGKPRSHDFDFSKVTPNNIDTLLNVHRKVLSLPVERPGELFISKSEDKEYGNWYESSMATDDHGTTGCSFKIENDQFVVHQNGTPDTQHRFDNFKEFLDYHLKGNFYQGSFFQKMPVVFIQTSDGTEFPYKNPYYKK